MGLSKFAFAAGFGRHFVYENTPYCRRGKVCKSYQSWGQESRVSSALERATPQLFSNMEWGLPLQRFRRGASGSSHQRYWGRYQRAAAQPPSYQAKETYARGRAIEWPQCFTLASPTKSRHHGPPADPRGRKGLARARVHKDSTCYVTPTLGLQS